MVRLIISDKQKEFVLSFIHEWAGSQESALKWYESEIIPSLNKTAKQAVDGGEFEAVRQYLEHIRDDGFA
ncbi:hypothetical protein [Colwellia sp. Bg11-28]|uniref:hypothetical protein n=1 Tax=Colwellia sp. Bg11-28 TaxID=2058305 RepID=UPI0012FF3473|nr:hypothetical protein [Colwellia sp. Bg11-28]